MGFTPAGKTPQNICDTIAKIYTDRYNSGYNNGYTNGRTQGQNDVKANPSAYGISVAKINQIKFNVYEIWGSNHTASHDWIFYIGYDSYGNITGVTGSYQTHDNGIIKIKPIGWS